MERKRRTYLIQDPYDDDAMDFIQSIVMYFGMRPVCLYTNAKDRFYGERQYPLLCGDLIEESVDIEGKDLAAVCAELTKKYDIRGVVPFREDTVELAVELCDLLDLGWIDGTTLARFRDKAELKRYVAEQDSGVRLPGYHLVTSADDVWSNPDLPPRFVIKPNDGLGNQRIGIFDSTEREAINAHVQSDPPTTWILEEFIGGPEFHVDGQVRSNGEIAVIGVFIYTRVSANGYETVYSGEQQYLTSDPGFDEIVAYAKRLLAATGLRRCPFHLEVKVDENGPCLIDLGARYGSDGGARTLSRIHPQRPDTFAIASHDYLGENSFGMEPVDFTFYDTERTVVAYGISDEDAGIIRSLRGVDAVEAMPEFVGWVVKPTIGDGLEETQELRGAPYIVELRHPGTLADGDALIARVQGMIRWNLDDDRLSSVRANAQHFADRSVQKLRWVVSKPR